MAAYNKWRKMFQDVVHSILKDYRETERLLSEKPSKLKI